MHGRVIPGSAAALSFFATFVFCVAVLSERMEEGFAFGAAFIALVITVPIAMLLLASFLTNPNWFGSRPVETWEEQPDLAKAGRRGWTIQQSP